MIFSADVKWPAGTSFGGNSGNTFLPIREFASTFVGAFQPADQRIFSLYEKAKTHQWNSRDVVDWSFPMLEENPLELPEFFLPMAGSTWYASLSAIDRGHAHAKYHAWVLSQFLHGEQAALICAGRLVQQAPDVESKMFAASQTYDEARHLETYCMLLSKFGELYPVSDSLKALISQTVSDSRWDITYIGMQVLIEGLALGNLGGIRKFSANEAVKKVLTYVMEDEARHVAFGRQALRQLYKSLGSAELAEREDFIIEASLRMREHFVSAPVWREFDIPRSVFETHIFQSELFNKYFSALFRRIVPVIQDIGLMTPRVQEVYMRLGALRSRASAVTSDEIYVA